MTAQELKTAAARLRDTADPMLWELCDGHPGRGLELRRYTLPNGHNLWLCRNCWTNQAITDRGQRL